MTSTAFSTLPYELVYNIGSFIRPEDLLSFLLVDKTTNVSATPYLYRDIDLSPLPLAAARSCIQALATSPDNLVFQRPLASLVHSLEIGCAESNPTEFLSQTSIT